MAKKKVSALAIAPRIFSFEARREGSGRIPYVRELTKNEMVTSLYETTYWHNKKASQFADFLLLGHCALKCETVSTQVEHGYIYANNAPHAERLLAEYYNGKQETATPARIYVELVHTDCADADLPNQYDFDLKFVGDYLISFVAFIREGYLADVSNPELDNIGAHKTTQETIKAAIAELPALHKSCHKACYYLDVSVAADPFYYTY
jgi:hypothetical protein